MSESYLAAAAKRSADSAASTSTDAQANEQEEKEQEEPTFHEKIRAILEAKDLTAAQDAIMRDPDIGRNKHIIIGTLPPGQWGKMDRAEQSSKASQRPQERVCLLVSRSMGSGSKIRWPPPVWSLRTHGRFPSPCG